MLEGDGVVGSAARRTWVDVSAERVMLSVAIFESFIGRAKGRIALCEIENEPQLPSEPITRVSMKAERFRARYTHREQSSSLRSCTRYR